jgi:hypothetical protein
MADKTGEQRRAHEGDDTGSQRRPGTFFFITLLTYNLRHTCRCYHCTPPPHRRLVSHDDDHSTHQNGSTTKGQRSRPTKAHEGQHRATVTNSQCRPIAANNGCPYAPTHIQKRVYDYSYTRFLYTLYILLLYLLLLFFM